MTNKELAVDPIGKCVVCGGTVLAEVRFAHSDLIGGPAPDSYIPGTYDFPAAWDIARGESLLHGRLTDAGEGEISSARDGYRRALGTAANLLRVGQ